MTQRIELTKKDRANVEFLASLYDLLWAGKQATSGHSVINFNRDADQLIAYGFEYSLTRASMFGTDNKGRVWQVATVDHGPSHNGGRFSRTVWYQIEDSGARTKSLTRVTWEKFYQMFSKTGGKSRGK